MSLKNNFKIVYKKNTYRYNYNTPKVSDLTILYIKKILKSKPPCLTTLKDYLEMHYPVIKSLCEVLSKKKKKLLIVK